MLPRLGRQRPPRMAVDPTVDRQSSRPLGAELVVDLARFYSRAVDPLLGEGLRCRSVDNQYIYIVQQVTTLFGTCECTAAVARSDLNVGLSRSRVCCSPSCSYVIERD